MVMLATHKPTFCLGNVVITSGALARFNAPECRKAVIACLVQHASGDWGIVNDEDKGLNDASLTDGSRILSAYMVDGEKVWIITDAADEDGRRHTTTILLPEEY